MKKALVLLLALVFVGGFAYAQGAPSVAINGFVETGVAAVERTSLVNEPSGIQYNNDSGNTGRFRLGIAITAADGNAGFVSRLEGDSGVIGNPGNNSSAGAWPIFFNRFLGWGNLAGGMITIKGGILDESMFWTANRNWGGWLDGAAGLELLVKPQTGLVLSYFLPAPFTPSDAGQSGGVLVDALSGLAKPVFYSGNGSLMDTLQGSSIQAAYSMPNLVNIVAGYHFFAATVTPTLGFAASGVTVTGSGPQPRTGYAWAGVDYIAMSNVTARVETQLKNIGDKDAGEYDFFLEGAYVMDQLKVDVGAWIYYYASSGSGLGWNIEPNVSYNLGYAKVGVVGDIGNIGNIYSGPLNAAARYGQLAGQGVKMSDTAINADIGPYIGVPISSAASVNAGLLYTIGDIKGKEPAANGAAGYIDVRYSF